MNAPESMQCNISSNTLAHWLVGDYNSNNINNNNYSDDDQCLFRRREPSMWIFTFYAFVVPSLSLFGLCANFINAIVFMRPKMSPSAFTYLAALSWLDCLSCLFITFTAFSRSIFFHSSFWLAYDLQFQSPLFGISTGAANLILACVSLDRLIYLWRGIPNGTPRLCRRIVARRMVIIVICISCAVNIPYFFVFIVNDDGTFTTTNLYYSTFYKIHNWFSFILLAILPALFLLIGNAAILIAFRRWTKQSKKCNKQCNGSASGSASGNGSGNCSGNSRGKGTQKRYMHQMKLTITILIVITLYLIGELPAHLTSRKCALNLLYSGDINKMDFNVMERLEIICITLNAVQLSMNILVYALINPSFMPEFFVCLRGASDACFRFLSFTAGIRYCRRHFHNKNRKCENQTMGRECTKESTNWSNDENIKNEYVDGERIGRVIYNCQRSKSLEIVTFDSHAMDKDILDMSSNISTPTPTPKKYSLPSSFY